MTFRHAAAGLLTQEVRRGYDLTAPIELELVPVGWRDFGQMHRTLDGSHDDTLFEPRRVRQRERPERRQALLSRESTS